MNRVDNKRPRLEWVTITQMIGCLLVVFGHSYPFVAKTPYWAHQVKVYIYMFHMPVFVWASGYLLSYTNASQKYSFAEYAAVRAKRILVPYVFFSLVGLVPKLLASNVLNDTLEFNTISLVKAFLVPRENIWGHFWFLPMIFFLAMIGYWFDRKQAAWILVLGGVVLLFAEKTTGWFALNDIRENLFYYGLGMVCSRYCATKIGKNRKRVLAGASALLVGSVLMFLCFGQNVITRICIAVAMIGCIVFVSILLESYAARLQTRNAWMQRMYAVVYNGPQEMDHIFQINREHGKIDQRKRKESILCHEGNTHRNLRPRSFWRYSRESGSWEPLLRRTT